MGGIFGIIFLEKRVFLKNLLSTKEGFWKKIGERSEKCGKIFLRENKPGTSLALKEKKLAEDGGSAKTRQKENLKQTAKKIAISNQNKGREKRKQTIFRL